MLLSLGTVKRILGDLRRKHHFDQLTKVADVIIQTGQNGENIRKQYVQALIEQRKLVAALDMLRSLEKDCLKSNNKVELDDARGLMGRARKQMYMNAANVGRPNENFKQHFRDSIANYFKVYEKNPDSFWHGINIVALLERARRDDIEVDEELPARGATCHSHPGRCGFASKK